MVVFTALEPEDIKIIVDGIVIANATSIDITRSKTIDKVDVIGTRDQRIAEGSSEISGSLTELKTNPLGMKMLRSQTVNNIAFQKNMRTSPGDVDTPVGEAGIQVSLNNGNTSNVQNFEAIGTRMEAIYLLAERNSAFTEDLTVLVKDGATTLYTLTVPNDQIPSSKGWIEYQIPADEQPILTKGSFYGLELQVPGSTAGQVSFYGADKTDGYISLGTGDGVETRFDLQHASVFPDTLFVKKGEEGFLGKEEGYSFGNNSGTGGLDEVIFDTAPANGVEIFARYEYNDNDYIAWRLGFGNATPPTYTIRYEMRTEDGVIVDAFEIQRVRFSSHGVSFNPSSFVERTLAFEGEIEKVIE